MTSQHSKHLHATHGIVCHLPDAQLGYFGWPSVARMDDGTLVVASSGLRQWHICPWGKVVINTSRNNGVTWSPPRIIRDTPIDDRDSGVISLGGSRLLVATFSSDPRPFVDETAAAPELRAHWREPLSVLTDEIVKPHVGSWILLSDDAGATWSAPIAAPASAPHGPILLRSGRLLYFGKDARDMFTAGIIAAASDDGGRNWHTLSEVPIPVGTVAANYHEPHLVELPSGQLIGLIRLENARPSDQTGGDLSRAGLTHFSIMQTESTDGGLTWTTAHPTTHSHGAPPHVIRHSSGVLVCVYSHRLEPFGQRAMLSYDDGMSWEGDWVIRADGPTWDLGYPASVELPDGSIFSVYYQQVRVGEPCAILWSHWRLPQRSA